MKASDTISKATGMCLKATSARPLRPIPTWLRPITILLGLTLDKMGKHEEATTEFKKAAELAPTNPAIKDSAILKKHIAMYDFSRGIKRGQATFLTAELALAATLCSKERSQNSSLSPFLPQTLVCNGGSKWTEHRR